MNSDATQLAVRLRYALHDFFAVEGGWGQLRVESTSAITWVITGAPGEHAALLEVIVAPEAGGVFGATGTDLAAIACLDRPGEELVARVEGTSEEAEQAAFIDERLLDAYDAREHAAAVVSVTSPEDIDALADLIVRACEFVLGRAATSAWRIECSGDAFGPA